MKILVDDEENIWRLPPGKYSAKVLGKLPPGVVVIGAGGATGTEIAAALSRVAHQHDFEIVDYSKIEEENMFGRIKAALGLASILGIGGAMTEPVKAKETPRENMAMAGYDRRLKQIIERSRDDQEAKRKRRALRWAKGRKK